MRRETPLFNAFGPLLFGKPDRASIAKLRDGLDGAHALHQLQSAFGHLIPAALLAREKTGANSRRRIFSPAVTFWAFLAQVLDRGSSCRDALRRLQAWWHFECPHLPAPSSDTSAYCTARGRLKDQALQQISAHLAGHLESRVKGAALWKN